MKTLKTLLTVTMTAIVLSATAFSSSAAEKVEQLMGVSTANPEIKKVIVSGSARVFLVQSDNEWVSYDSDDAKKVSIKQVGNSLYINSTEKSPVTLTVYVKNPYRVDASNNAVVKTVGKFNVPYLQLMLKDNATARIKAKTESLYTVVDDHSNLELLGSTGSHVIKAHAMASLNTDKFAALTTSREPLDTEVAMNVDSTSSHRIIQRASKKVMR